MFNSSKQSHYGRHVYILKKIRVAGLIIITLLVIIGSIFGISRARSGISNEKRELYRVWADADYERAYEITKNLLINKPVDYLFLTVNGFSAYQLGISQINYQSMLYYIDECIFSLRKALIQNSNDASVYYVLGKAYRQKGREYADLSVKFLEMADKLSYKAADIPEYLGLSYAEYGDYRSSVEAFSRVFAAGQKPSDNILLSIARSYMEMEEYNMAMSYLQNCIDNSEDSKAKVFARYMLAEIYRNTKDFEKAENQYSVILGVIGENAETRYQLGVLYSQQGDNTRARSQWREAFRLDPTHARARARL